MAPVRVCETCETEFEHRKKKSYCCRACDPKRNKTCVECGSDFVDESRTNQRRYCGSQCNPSTRKSRDKECGYCGDEFHDDSKQNSMKFCDPSCRRKAKKIRLAQENDEEPPMFLDEQTWECVRCGTEYTPNNANQEYCSISCREDGNFEDKYASVPEHLSRQVLCLECGEMFRGCIPHGGRAGDHFQDEHGMSSAEYQEKHPEATIYCDASIWKQHQKSWTATEKQCLNYSEAKKAYYEENEQWIKGRTKEDCEAVAAIARKAEERLADPTNNPFYGKTHTEESRQLMSEAVKAAWQTEEYRENYWEARRDYLDDGGYISGPHQDMIDAMKGADLYGAFGFQPEAYVTLLDGSKHPIDIASREHKIAIEIDGCFYHGCPEHGNLDKLSSEWQEAIKKTQERDALVDRSLMEYGWTVFRFWEHDVVEDLEQCVVRVCNARRSV